MTPQTRPLAALTQKDRDFRRKAALSALGSAAPTSDEHALLVARRAWAMADALLYTESEDSADLWPVELPEEISTPLTLLSDAEVASLLMSAPEPDHPANAPGTGGTVASGTEPAPDVGPTTLETPSVQWPVFLTPAQRIAAATARQAEEAQARIVERVLRSVPPGPLVGPRVPHISLQSALSLVAKPAAEGGEVQP